VKQGGSGCHFDLSLLDVQIALHSYRVPQALTLGVNFGPQPRQGGSGARPYGPFQTKDGRWFVLAITIPFWKGFCLAVGRPDLTEDPRFVDDEARLRNAGELDVVVGDILASRTAEEWQEIFLAHELPGSPVRTLDEAFSDPSTRVRGMLRVLPGFPVVYSKTPVGAWNAPAYRDQLPEWPRVVKAADEG
jgi:crotonobetainyl-CoA:carnitine CoA-transferase CaiB-like acyl-CoA transferase